MTLQYAKEVLIIEIAQVIENKNKQIDSLDIQNTMLQQRIIELESKLNEQQKEAREL